MNPQEHNPFPLHHQEESDQKLTTTAETRGPRLLVTEHVTEPHPSLLHTNSSPKSRTVLLDSAWLIARAKDPATVNPVLLYKSSCRRCSKSAQNPPCGMQKPKPHVAASESQFGTESSSPGSLLGAGAPINLLLKHKHLFHQRMSTFAS